MEIYTSAARSIISDQTFTQLWPEYLCPSLKPTNAALKTYTGERIKPLGVISAQVKVNNQKEQLDLLVVPGNGPSLLGRDWLSCLRLYWAHIRYMNNSDTLQVVLARHPTVFEESLGLVQGTTAKIHVDPAAQPKFFKARPVPYALRDNVDKEIDHLVKEGIIQPVTHSDWQLQWYQLPNVMAQFVCVVTIKLQSTNLLSLIVTHFHALTICLLLFQVGVLIQSWI